MKRVLSALIAGAMVAAMAVPAFAAGTAAPGKVYDSDGAENDDVWGKITNTAFMKNITIDGVVPGAELYIPLGDAMDDTVDADPSYPVADIAAQMVTDSKATKTLVSALAANSYVLNEDGDGDVEVDPEKVAPAGAYVDDGYCYVVTDASIATDITNAKTALKAKYKVSLENLTDKDLFKFDYDKDDGSKYVSKIELVSDKKLGDITRTAYVKITLADSTTTSDLKTTGSISFKAKKSSTSAKVKDDKWDDDQKYEFNYTIWMNNVKKSNDDNVDTGDRVYFDPDDNEDNTLIWGDDRAGLYFEANDDASKFYARLQTKVDSSIYSEYGDPVDADLWFYDFVGNPTVPSTARATLTLGIPWDEDDDYTPNPEDCFIYEKQSDGTLKDVTSQFTYDEDNDGTTEIDGWTIKTRTLGTYVISDTALDLDVADDVVDEEPVDTSSDVTDTTGKQIPNTGSSDMVGVAMVAAAVSLAAAGAVAFKKASK